MNGTKGLVVQLRDRRLLQALETMRILDRDQAMAVAGFHSVTRANTRLLRLKNAGLLNRLFVGSRAGNRKALYALSAKGASLAGVQLWHLNRRSVDRLIVDPFIEHQLAVNSFRILINKIPQEDFWMREWKAFREPISAVIPIAPDGYFEIEGLNSTQPMFLEVDRGTEGQRIWKAKTQSYVKLALSGEFQRRFGHERFRVLVVAHSARRLNSIRKAVCNHTSKIFWFSDFETINREGFWPSTWLRPKGEQRQSLLESLYALLPKLQPDDSG
jgi:hypothetical protein